MCEDHQSCRIAIYIPSLRGGGAERVMVTLANGFAARGMQVDLVLASAEGPYLRDISQAVHIIDLRSRRVSTSLPGLVHYLRGTRPKVLLSALNHANVIAVLAHRLARVPTRLVVSERNNASHSANHPQSLRQRCVLPMMRWAYRKADAIVAVSEGVADDLAQSLNLSRERIDVVYNPVVTPGLEALAATPIDHPWLAENSPPVILAVGRLAAQKDYPTLLRAFAMVRAKHDYRLVILGEGKLRPLLEALVEKLGVGDSVLLPGFIDNPFAWMRRASLFVLSSAWEGLPNVLIQAMACGTQVVSTDCPSGPREILEGGKWGALVPVGDQDALAEEIISSMNSRNSMRGVSRAYQFGVDNAISGYLKVMFPELIQ